MSKGALVDWRSEVEAIHREMDYLFKAGWLETAANGRFAKFSIWH